MKGLGACRTASCGARQQPVADQAQALRAFPPPRPLGGRLGNDIESPEVGSRDGESAEGRPFSGNGSLHRERTPFGRRLAAPRVVLDLTTLKPS